MLLYSSRTIDVLYTFFNSDPLSLNILRYCFYDFGRLILVKMAVPANITLQFYFLNIHFSVNIYSEYYNWSNVRIDN